MPQPYQQVKRRFLEDTRRVVGSAQNTLVVFSGGSRVSDEDLREETRLVMKAGATGLIVGRNLWQRPKPQAFAITERIRQNRAKYGAPDAC